MHIAVSCGAKYVEKEDMEMVKTLSWILTAGF